MNQSIHLGIFARLHLLKKGLAYMMIWLEKNPLLVSGAAHVRYRANGGSVKSYLIPTEEPSAIVCRVGVVGRSLAPSLRVMYLASVP